MCINIRITHETINIGSGISITDTNLGIIGYKLLLGTEGYAVESASKPLRLGCIISLVC